MLVLIVGPSGAGKDTLLDGARAALAADRRFCFVRRAITRPADAGGEDHDPLTPAAFAARRAAGGFALAWSAHGLDYGIPADPDPTCLPGVVVVASVSRTVIAQAAARFPVRVIEITAAPEARAARLASRGREAGAALAERLTRSVALPDGIDVVTLRNDASIAEGVAALTAAISRAAPADRQ